MTAGERFAHRARTAWTVLARTAGRSPRTLCALGAALLLLQLLLAAVERRTEWNAPLARERVSVRGFDLVADGGLRGSATPDGFHALETLVEFGRTGKLRDYDVRFDVLAAAPSNVVLRVDLFAAPSYDDPAQERARLIGVETVGTRVALRINSGWVPRQAYLRVVYFGPPGLALGPIHFRAVPILLSALDHGLRWTGWALLLCAGWLAIARRALPGAPAPGAVCSGHAAWPLAAIYLAAALGHVGVHLFAPLWRGDELQYKTSAALLWWLGPDASGGLDLALDLPGRLYPYLISPAFAAGDQFYGVIRLINALLMSSVVFPTFAIARRHLPRAGALLVSALAATLPFAHLSAYAVTEVVFFPLYVAAAWLTLESIREPDRLRWPIAVGAVAALALCARPSGVVVLPAFFACRLWTAARRRTLGEHARSPRWLLALAAFVPVYLAVQWLTGVQTPGSPGFYAPSLQPRAPLLGDPGALLDLALGHLTTLSIPLALPLALVLCAGAPRERADLASLCSVAAIFFGALFVLGLAFTVLVSGSDLGGLGRWHSRYYFHAYPLLLLAAAALLAAPAASPARRGPGVAIVVALLLAHLWFMELRPASQSAWFGSIVDNMDVQWFAAAGALRWVLLAASAGLTWLWYRDDPWLRPAAVALAVLWVGVANLGTVAKMGVGGRLAPDACGKLATSFLEQQPGPFAIVGTDPEFRDAAMFWSPYLPSFVGSPSAAASYLAGPSVPARVFVVTDGSEPPDPSFELRVDAGACRIYARP